VFLRITCILIVVTTYIANKGVKRIAKVMGITRLLIRRVAHPRREAAIAAKPAIRIAVNILY
jgi:hypothetical protein